MRMLLPMLLRLQVISLASKNVTLGAFLPCRAGSRRILNGGSTNSRPPPGVQCTSCPGYVSNLNQNPFQSTFHSSALSSERNGPNERNRRMMLLAEQIKKFFSRLTLRGFLASFSLIALIFMLPLKSNAASPRNTSSKSSVEYYLQNDPNHYRSSGSSKRVVSIQTQSPSTLASSPPKYSNEIQSSRNYTRKRIRSHESRRQKGQRISFGLVVASLAAASFRASLRKSKIVRNVTPFGIIRNASPLGNGVSVIRLRMALEFRAGDGDNSSNDCKSFLDKLHREEYKLYASISMLAQQQLRGSDVYQNKQGALVKYLSNVASIFHASKHAIKYGSMASVRVPFVEDAINEFRSISNQERLLFDESKEKLPLFQVDDENNQKVTDSGERQFVVASVVLAIKGDHTSSPFQFGISTQKDMGRALSRIATDAQVESCLVGTEVMWMPRELNINQSGGVLKESDIFKVFPDAAPLS
ncbi:hypothetical protein HJC23_010927 [Cyclotella cryptica]|uniref:Uncharacterized protein n=1 Tax=Cyclotella cryptica TaxID=29204 RepID=A0ABD3Q9E2_9STRA|eukprot:CCRYP_007559-RA/>CCRYP_007559-RA protein AED:0.01 eAED:0.01 QI:340/1/1/1/1/1/2/1154/470